MEICGGQTHTLMRYGIDEILPRGMELVHGPGCPVCVTSLETIDKAIQIASRPDVTLISYGDMPAAGLTLGSSSRQGARRRCKGCLFPDRGIEVRPGQSRSECSFFCRRI